MLMAAWKPHSYIEPTSAAGVEKRDRASELTTNTAKNKCNDGGVPPKKYLQSQVERWGYAKLVSAFYQLKNR